MSRLIPKYLNKKKENLQTQQLTHDKGQSWDYLFLIHPVFARVYIHTYSPMRVGIIDFSSSYLKGKGTRIEIFMLNSG
jgi:hypothetical protein